MPDQTITLATGRAVRFEVPAAGDGPACFVLGVRKCGSTLLNRIVAALAQLNGRGFIDIGHTFFAANVLTRDWQRDGALRDIVRPGVAFGGFRDAPLCLLGDEAFVHGPKILLVRDPRDALVSEYFSNAYSHEIPPPSDGADAMMTKMLQQRAQALTAELGDYVLRMAPAMTRTMMLYAPVLALPNLRVAKYEAVIFRKRLLIWGVASHFGWRVDRRDVDSIMAWADEVPAGENPHAFVRRVRPGDHREKLDGTILAKLNEIVQPAMELFGYVA